MLIRHVCVCPGRTSATNLNLSDDDLSGGAMPRLRVNPRIRDNIASWSGPSAGGRRVPPVLQHSYTLPALYETRLDETSDEEEKKPRGASDDEKGTRVKFKQLRLATKLKRCVRLLARLMTRKLTLLLQSRAGI